jgi:hypothetical protein
MITAALHVLVIGAMGMLVRRAVLEAPAAWRLVAGVAGAAAAVVLADPTQERVYAATTGFGGSADLVSAAGPAGDFAGGVLLAMTVVLALPRVRGMLVGNGATPLECCAANDLNHRP